MIQDQGRSYVLLLLKDRHPGTLTPCQGKPPSDAVPLPNPSTVDQPLQAPKETGNGRPDTPPPERFGGDRDPWATSPDRPRQLAAVQLGYAL